MKLALFETLYDDGPLSPIGGSLYDKPFVEGSGNARHIIAHYLHPRYHLKTRGATLIVEFDDHEQTVGIAHVDDIHNPGPIEVWTWQ